jgi:hypothetical protein
MEGFAHLPVAASPDFLKNICPGAIKTEDSIVY